MSNRADRTKLLHELLDERIAVMDGAMGTAIHQHDLPIDEFGGPAFENCNEILNPRRPDIILDIYSSYLEAGSDIIETNSFNGTPADMGEFGLKEQTQEINRKRRRPWRVRRWRNTRLPENPVSWPARWGRPENRSPSTPI